jgi:hypothetical protein
MAQRLTAPPGVSDAKNFRAREAFEQHIEAHGKLVGSTTVDVGSIAAGGIGTVTIAVVGARADVGMTVAVGLPSTINTGLVPWGNVTADDEVTVYLYNRTVGAIDPVSATYSAWVRP